MAYYLNQQDNNQQIHRGSNPGHRVIHRGRANAERNLWADYFAKNPRYPDSMFRRRFRLGRSLFLCIVNAVEVMITTLYNDMMHSVDSDCLVYKK